MTTIKDLLEERLKTLDEITIINTQLTKLKDEISQIEQEIHARMAAEGIEKTGIKGSSVHIKQEIAPKITDWVAVYKYIQERGAFGLLQKRISSTYFKELVDAGKIPPGMEVTCFEKLAFRKT